MVSSALLQVDFRVCDGNAALSKATKAHERWAEECCSLFKVNKADFQYFGDSASVYQRFAGRYGKSTISLVVSIRTKGSTLKDSGFYSCYNALETMDSENALDSDHVRRVKDTASYRALHTLLLNDLQCTEAVRNPDLKFPKMIALEAFQLV